MRQLCCPNISATCTMVIMIYCHTEVLGKLKKILLLSQLLGGSWRWVHWWMLFDQQSAVAWNIVSSSIVCRRIALYCQCRIVTLLPVQNPRTANLISIKTSFVQLNSTSLLFPFLSAASSFHQCCCCQLSSKPVFGCESSPISRNVRSLVSQLVS